MSFINLLEKRTDELERDRTETSPEKLRYGGVWLGVPVFFALGGLFLKRGHGYWDRAGVVGLWVGFVLVVTAFVLGCSLYQRRVPIKIQILMDLLAWSVLAWMFFQFRFWDL